MENKKALLFILATILLDAIGVGIVFPIMPDLMAHVGAGTTADGAVWGGILMVSYAAMQFLFSPVIGAVSDAVGRKPVLLIALATLAVDYAIMAMATTLGMLLVGRILAGIAGATYTTATAYLADISKREKRAASFGLIGATYGVGFVFGPAIGGLAAGWHLSAPFWLAAGLAAVNVVFGLFVLPESLPKARRRAFRRADMNPFAAILGAFRLPGLALPLACLFVFEFANMVYPTLWAFWTREVFGWSTAVIGITLAAYGVGVAFSQGMVLPMMVARLGEFRTLIFGLLCGVGAMIIFGVTQTAWVVFAVIILAALSDMVPPTMTAILSGRVDEDRQGVLQGVIASLGSISAVIAPLVMTSVFQASARHDGAFYLPGAPFLMSAALLIIMLPFALRLVKNRRSTKN